MSTTVGTIQYDVRLNLNQLKSDVKQAEKIVNDSNRNIEKSSEKTGGAVSGMFATIATAAKVAGAAAVAAFGSFSVFGLKTAGQLEATEKGFITLLGSTEEAGRVMARIKEEAKRTPFEMAGLASATQLLSSVTKDGDKAIDFLLDVGESLAAMGKGQAELDRIIVNLQQIGAVGEASMLDIKQFAFAGIPIFEMLQETTGKTGEALEDMISNGEVTFELLEKMFREATDEGGRFAGAFKNQAGTFNQSVSNMKDTFMIFASDFVKRTGIFDGAVKVIGNFTNALGNNQEQIYKTVDAIKNIILQALALGRNIAEYLSPKLEALWNTFSQKLIPTLSEFWKRYLEPLIPIIGVVLVGALGLAIDAVNLIVTVFTKFIDWINNNQPLIIGLATAFGILKGAMIFDTVVNAIIVQFNLLKLVHIPSLMASFGALKAAIASPVTMGAIGIGAAIWALAEVKKAWDELKRIRDEIAKSENTMADARTQYGQSLKRRFERGEITAEERARLWKESALPGNANGTNHWKGGPTWVGERGPEIVNLPKGSQVIPNHKAGAGGVNISLNMSGVMARSRTDLREIAKDMIGAINEELRAKGKMELAV